MKQLLRNYRTGELGNPDSPGLSRRSHIEITWKTCLGITIGIVFLYLACRKIDLDETLLALRTANYVYLVPTVILTVGSVLIRAYRWKFLLRAIESISFPRLLSATSIGLMANNLLPARLGEFVRAYAIGQANVSRSSAFATIVVERILDLFTLLPLLAVILVFFPFPAWMVKSGYLVFLFNVAVLGLLILLRVLPGKVERFCTSILAPLPRQASERFTVLLKSFIDGLKVLSDIWALLSAVTLSIGLWSAVALAIWFACLAFSFDLPFYAPLVVLILISIGIMIPSAPGFVGTFQFFSVTVLSLFDIQQNQALSFSIAFHATQFIPITLTGLSCLWASKLSLTRVVRAKDGYKTFCSKE